MDDQMAGHANRTSDSRWIAICIVEATYKRMAPAICPPIRGSLHLAWSELEGGRVIIPTNTTMWPTARSLQSRLLVAIVFVLIAFRCGAQIDPEHRALLELGYDQPLVGQGPQGIYAYFYYNHPDFFKTNAALRVAIAPAYLDSEVGFRQLLSPYTDLGLGINGGAYGDNYYEVRQGDYIKEESFDGHGGGVSASIYQLLNPGMLIPLNLVARGGFHYSTFDTADQTAAKFVLPQDQVNLFTRAGLRLAGKEPVLYPDLGLELSFWYERQWRLEDQTYGFANDRRINPGVNLYWLYAGLNYTFTNTGQQVSFAVTAGGSTDADRFSAWRLGGVLPLISEFPLTLPGYYYEELTARAFLHLYAAYDVPLDRSQRFKFRIEAAAANLDYLPGFEQSSVWQSGAGCGLTFAPRNKNFQIVLRYGYGFNAIRDGHEGAHSVGVLFQYDFGPHKTGAD